MKLSALAIAASLVLAAGAAQASPATVLPDTGHAIVRGTKQIVQGTVHGVGHQVGNVGYAARQTGNDAKRAVRRNTHRRPRHHHHRFHRHTVVTHKTHG